MIVNGVLVEMYIGVDVKNITNFILKDLLITVVGVSESQEVGMSGISVYGMRIESCSGYSLIRVSLYAGAASSGGIGTNGSYGLPGR